MRDGRVLGSHCSGQHLSAADKAALFKTFTKVICQKAGLMACFMANGPRIAKGRWPSHQSSNKDGSSAFFDESAEDEMSPLMRSFQRAASSCAECWRWWRYRQRLFAHGSGAWAPTSTT